MSFDLFLISFNFYQKNFLKIQLGLIVNFMIFFEINSFFNKKNDIYLKIRLNY